MKVRQRIGRPAAALLGALLLANLAILAAHAAGFRINTTASMPTGIYRVTPYRSGPIARGTLVAFCPGSNVLAVALARHYLAHGPCPGDVEPLLKEVAGIAGDRVDVSDSALSINGRTLRNSGRVARDCAYRPLPRIARGRYVLSPATVWLYAPVARSWDSRYYGPQATSGVIGIAHAILLVGQARTCTS